MVAVRQVLAGDVAEVDETVSKPQKNTEISRIVPLTSSAGSDILADASRIVGACFTSSQASRTQTPPRDTTEIMAKKKKKAARKATRKKTTRKGSKKKGGDLIISKSRTKAAAGINVSGDFYGALDEAVRNLIASAEARANNNNRRTLRPHDL